MLASVREARARIAHAPPFWAGATLARESALERTGRVFDGWIPTAPSAESYAAGWKSVRAAATAAGRDPGALTPAVYLTISLADDAGAAEAALRAYIEPYYGISYDVMRRVQGMCAGTPAECAEWLAGYARAGVRHFVLRSPDLAGQIDTLAREVVPRLRALFERSRP
jgi:alkanesulfonate monooxygenase SsuD/methylene tetrahydromethanopterin reductase-like flavin-dependent oxidoreductase (luciferase family)